MANKCTSCVVGSVKNDFCIPVLDIPIGTDSWVLLWSEPVVAIARCSIFNGPNMETTRGQ